MIFWFINITLICLLGWWIFKVVKKDLFILIFSTSLFARLAAGVIAGLVYYKLYPGGDSTSFYNAATIAIEENSILTILTGDFSPYVYDGQPRVVFFIQILTVVLLLSGGSYWIATLYFALISFSASIYFVVQFNRLFPNLKTIDTLCFLYLPSVLFWSSGILKDTISFSAFVIVIAQVLKIHKRGRIIWIENVIGVIALIVLLKIKHYLLIISLLFAGLIIGIRLFKKLGGPYKWSIPVLAFIAIFSLTQFVHPYLKIDRLPQTIYENNKIITERTRTANQLGIIIDKPTWLAVIKEIPDSMYAGLFSPTFFDKTPIWGMGHKVENFILTSLLFFSILILIKQRPKIDWELILPAALCIGILASLLAMSTPNLGTLVRYKNAFLPFLFLMASVLPYQYLTSKSA